VDKTQRLDDLFRRWEFEHRHRKGEFRRDGIFDESRYSTADPKLLFIVKEPNVSGAQVFDGGPESRDTLHHDSTLSLYKWTFGIFNCFPLYEDIPRDPVTMLDTLARTAFMYLRKTARGTVIRPEEFEERAFRDRAFILEQIEIIAPDVIVGCVRDFRLWSKIFGNDIVFRQAYDTALFRFKEMKVIDFFHPAYHISSAALYSLLQNVYNSQPFREL
jgi:hypothetical protein